MKITVTGTRGIPGIQGGVETHCEKLYPRIAAMGHDVTVIRRTPYLNDSIRADLYKGVHLLDIGTPRKKSLEAIIHTFKAVVKAKRQGADIVHIHAIGPGLLVPFARLLGLKVVSTNHGPDYDRQKWGRLAKALLRLGERLAAKYSHRVIVISPHIQKSIAEKYNRRDTILIPNGVEPAQRDTETGIISSWGLEPRKYILAVGRFVEEKGFHDLIEAFKSLGDTGYRLVIAGDSDHPDHYSEMLKQKAHANGVVLTGFIKGQPLQQLFTNAALYVMPSYHEGLPIALLEAMSYDLDVAVSDIPANRLPQLDATTDYFQAGNISALAGTIKHKLSNPKTGRVYDLRAYDWDKIARDTERVYKSLFQ